jgi:hypothetical protein
MSSIKTSGRILLLVLAGCLLLTTTSSAQKVGSTSMQFLKVMPSARGAALGEAYSVWATGAEAIFWNPAGLATVRNMELSSSYIDWLFDSQQGALSYALAIRGFGAIGIQVQYVDFGEFEETSNQRPYINDPERVGLTGRTFRPFSYLVGITYARYLTERFSLGLSMKYAHESLFDGSTIRTMVRQGVFEDVETWADGFLFDFGIRYNTGYRSVHIASSVQNFGADVKYAKESNPVPAPVPLRYRCRYHGSERTGCRGSGKQSLEHGSRYLPSERLCPADTRGNRIRVCRCFRFARRL